MNTDTGQSGGVHRELSGAVIGAAMKEHRVLRPGLDEKIYENALVVELRKLGHAVEQQRSFDVRYEGERVGRFIPDLIVNGKIIVDPKVVENFNDAHIAQMLGYLAITQLPLALLLNFKLGKLQVKRVSAPIA
ncbi:GxxExxY protein [Synoicihabitans lomoniglobus]|uniref:GxxExxY protein n=1 Tax=Synoicihabitans lomoniglobus TaxID=2909285 RepID=A0AAF0CI55_9BACT|nr:GxxExxY protein [Opitutaceae bacterium LMO-M01]WED65012.1 GxxExxY protein [Opitutaceae bacterium LMO-M01]